MNSKDVALAAVVLVAAAGIGGYAYYEYTQSQSSSPSPSSSPSGEQSPSSSSSSSSSPPPTTVPPFTLTFDENGIPNGTSWYVNVNGVDYYTNAPNQIVVNSLTEVADWSAPTLYGGQNVFGVYTWKYTPTPSQGSADSTETIYITYEGSYNL